MSLDYEDHRRLGEMLDDPQRPDDVRFMARCLWRINQELYRREDYKAEQAEQGD